MKCLSCDCILSSMESTRKYKYSSEFIDLCNYCFNKTDLKLHEVKQREDLEETIEDIETDHG